MRKSSDKILCATVAAGLLASVAASAQAQSIFEIRAGGEIIREGGAGDVEAILAPNGIDNDGVFIRVYGRHSRFGFDSALSRSGEAEASTFDVNLSIGYRLVFGQIVASPYVGVDYFDRDIAPAASDVGQLGDDIGVIVGGRVDNSAGPASGAGIVWSVEGYWSSANNRYAAELELGYDFGSVAVGPEAGALGDDEFNAFRAGMFGRLDLPNDAFLKVGAGYQFGDASANAAAPASGDDTAYGTITFGFDF